MVSFDMNIKMNWPHIKLVKVSGRWRTGSSWLRVARHIEYKAVGHPTFTTHLFHKLNWTTQVSKAVNANHIHDYQGTHDMTPWRQQAQLG